jgi:acyl-CoA synthetase (NDP forming)
MRVVGPNCLGSIGVADKSIATFSVALEAAFPAAGPVGIVSQSGNLGSYTMRLATERGMGISRLLTTGNECDVDIADGIASLASTTPPPRSSCAAWKPAATRPSWCGRWPWRARRASPWSC